MLLPRLGALLLAVSTARAFKNTSPFFVLSSEPLRSDSPLQSTQIALWNDLEDRLIETLQDCDKKWYYIFAQDSVRSSDFKNGAMAKMNKRILEAEKGSVVEIPEVAMMGELSAQSIQTRLEKACSSKGKKSVDSWPEQDNEYRIVDMQLPQLLSEPHGRYKLMKDTDDAIEDTVTSVLSKDSSAVLIYITTPPPRQALIGQDCHSYEMDDPYPSAPHTELKRNLGLRARQSDNDDMQAGLPLFEKYQFLSPPIFTGLTVSVLLLLILFVGLRAISGLEVSYLAFAKEMGPQAQKPKGQ